MVELLVALIISMLIALAAIAALTVTRQGFSAVDASAQLRDNGRFAADLLQRMVVQSGYKDVQYAATTLPTTAVTGLATNPDSNVFGFNNALINSTDPTHASNARSTSVAGYGSDVLVLRYQGVETFPGSGVADGSMIDCAGNGVTAIPISRYDRRESVIHVAVSVGEPALMCTWINPASGTITTQPIVQGVENFQILYGTDGVTAGAAPTTATDSVPDAYLRADQLTVAGNAVATNDNWRRVRSIRIGMVLRGPANSAIDRTSATYYPFGAAKPSSTGTAGLAMAQTVASALDPGTVFTPAIDGRLRQTLSFTVHLRNDQGL
ncbi:PilW family protein [Rhodoferax sp. PAMC 29310]|uniref:PilW family protein n=1 Tax=Rhodoferax sp. PAMC 29310 TaxID=2822760 RepID=UPI001F0A9D84|nr:PilW family protein [Rhodoferax sp. PAMC 29310]